MSVASTRVSLQWVPKEPFENTDTLVLTSNEAHFVDIRILKDHKNSDLKVPADWVITGKEQIIPNDKNDGLLIEFQHEINTHLSQNSGGEFDKGLFNDLPDGLRKETGVMENLETGKVEEYEEIWKSIDPLSSTPDNNVFKLEENDPTLVPSVTLKVKNDKYLGTVVRLGNFLQGAILNKSSNEYSIVRYFRSQNKWGVVFQYGDEFDKIPTDGEGLNTLVNGLEWEVIEKTL